MSNRNRGGQPGNKNALKHGFYAHIFKNGEVSDIEGMNKGVDDEIVLLKVLIRRVLENAKEGANENVWLSVLGALGTASIRLATLIKTKKLLEGEFGATEALNRALSELSKDWSNGS